jgi:hypothetical protein
MLAFQQFSTILFLSAALLAAIAGISLFIRYRTLLANRGGAFLLANSLYLLAFEYPLTQLSQIPTPGYLSIDPFLLSTAGCYFGMLVIK